MVKLSTDLSSEEVNSSKKMKRIASIDFLRGLAIWMMVFLHVFNHKYNYDWVFEAGIENIFQITNPFFAIFILFSGFFGNWVGIFILVSGVVNTVSFVKRVSRGDATSRVFFKQILTGFGILIAGFIAESFGYYGYFGTLIKTRIPFMASTWISNLEGVESLEQYALLADSNIVSKIWTQIFRMEALQIIGYLMIIIAIVLFFLNRNDGYKKVKRNLFIVLGLIVVIAVSTPFLWYASEQINWIIPASASENVYHLTWPSMDMQVENASFGTYLMMVLTGDYYPLFPYLITSLVGVGFGIVLAMEKPPKRLPLWGLLTTIILGAIGGITATFMHFDINFERPTFPFFFMLLASQVGLMTLLLWLVEYRGKSQKFGNNIVVKYFRIWGVLSLSIFVLQIYHLVPYAIFNPAFKTVNLLGGQFGQGGEYWVLLLAFITVLFFDLIVWAWARFNFVLSFEWMIQRLSSLSTKEKPDKLNFKKILNEVEWIDYKKLSGREKGLIIIGLRKIFKKK